MNPDAFEVLERNIEYLKESMILAVGEIAHKEADTTFEETPYTCYHVHFEDLDKKRKEEKG